ncbi:MAG TPA: PIN domain-containing protein [Puia sp.]|jgi:predicted nucleic acid-binding protein|nr:PIN domain-containing protein [Puia sp.]
MAFRVFLDAGILLDLTLKRESYAAARQLMEWAVKGRIQVYVTPAIIQVTGRRLKQTYGVTQAKELLLALLAEVSVIDGGHTVAVSALHSTMSDMDEALSYYTALHHKLDYFITRDEDLPKAAIPVLPVCTPEEFIKSNQ